MIQGAELTAVISLVVSVATLVWNEVRFRRQHRAETAINKLLVSRGWRKRTFDAIKLKIGGYEDNELRRLLVRSGAVRFKAKDGDKELWGLLKKNKKIIEGDNE